MGDRVAGKAMSAIRLRPLTDTKPMSLLRSGWPGCLVVGLGLRLSACLAARVSSTAALSGVGLA